MKRSILLSIYFLMATIVHAQSSDTVLTFQQAKARLLTYNLGMLASYYNVGIAKAKVIQARVWSNPNFVVNGEMYNQETNEYFNLRNQSIWQFENVVSIAGKHTNSVKLARIGVEMAEKQMEDVLRSLLYELGNTYNDVAALQSKEILYQQVLSNYDRLMAASRKQLEVGTLSPVEAVRLEAEYLGVKADAIEIKNERAKVTAHLRILLQYRPDTVFFVQQKLPLVSDEMDPVYLSMQAIDTRPDVLAAKINIRYQERNLRLQRSTAFPDLKLGYQPFDRASNYIRSYHGFTTELLLPIFNHNQGQIKEAKLSLAQSELQFKQIENTTRNEVAAAYNRYRSSLHGISNYSNQFLGRLDDLNTSTNEHFKQRNISLLQFIDQQRIYILTNIQLIELKRQYLNTVNELNFSVGQTLIDF